MRQRYGFDSFKLKGGVFPPDEEIAAMKALAEAFPGSPLRLDPNTAWTVETSRYVARELEGVVEYVEDPTPTLAGMAEVAETSPMPLATNMCVIAWEHLRPPWNRTRSRSSSPTTTTGAGCAAPVNSRPSARRSASDSRCTPTPTSASASPR